MVYMWRPEDNFVEWFSSFHRFKGLNSGKKDRWDAGVTDGRMELLQEAKPCRGSTKISESKSSLETPLLLTSCKTPHVQD